jgi:hypothetical protein
MLAVAINQDIAMAESINNGLRLLDAASDDRETERAEAANLFALPPESSERIRRARPYRRVLSTTHCTNPPFRRVSSRMCTT